MWGEALYTGSHGGLVGIFQTGVRLRWEMGSGDGWRWGRATLNIQNYYRKAVKTPLFMPYIDLFKGNKGIFNLKGMVFNVLGPTAHPGR
jgi:hypothetical protein